MYIIQTWQKLTINFWEESDQMLTFHSKMNYQLTRE